jgi:hypothetical protein
MSGVLMIVEINRAAERSAGLGVREAIVQGSLAQMRPVLMMIVVALFGISGYRPVTMGAPVRGGRRGRMRGPPAHAQARFRRKRRDPKAISAPPNMKTVPGSGLWVMIFSVETPVTT